MTDISVTSTSYQVENRRWLLSEHGTDPGTTPSITLDVSAFTAATHYPNGYLLSGILLAQLTTGPKLYVPYVDAGANGQGIAKGFLFSSLKVPNLLDLTKDVGGALVVHGFVDPTKLPIADAASGGGFLDTAARAELPLIHFAS